MVEGKSHVALQSSGTPATLPKQTPQPPPPPPPSKSRLDGGVVYEDTFTILHIHVQTALDIFIQG